MRKGIIMAGIIASLLNLIGCKGTETNDYNVADVYQGLRDQIFSIDPKNIGIKEDESQVWGVLMETGYPEAVATLLTIADGTTSLYFSNGGGIIGSGKHENVRKVSHEYLKDANSFLKYCKSTNNYPLPQKGYTKFYFLTFNGVLTYEAKENDLGNNRMPLSPLFLKAHEIITEARIIDEERMKKK